MRVSVVALLAGLLATPAAAQNPPLEFRGARLGMSQAEWKALPVPEQVMRPAEPRCSDEDPTAIWARQLPESVAAGIVSCVYVSREGGYATGQKLGSSELTSVEYLFQGGKLYAISMIGVDLAAPALAQALRDKYGPPTSTGEGEVTNRAGNTVRQTTTTWKAGGQTIGILAPSLRLDRFSALISDDAAWAAAEAAKKRARGAADTI